PARVGAVERATREPERDAGLAAEVDAVALLGVVDGVVAAGGASARIEVTLAADERALREAEVGARLAAERPARAVPTLVDRRVAAQAGEGKPVAGVVLGRG